MEKYNNNKDSLYCIELIEVDVKKIKFQNLSEIINYFNGLIKFFMLFLITSFSLSGIFTILLINNFKKLVKEIKNDNKVYLEEVKNDTIIDV